LVHCANTGTEMISSFIDSSIDNVMLHINSDLGACQLLLEFINIPERHLVDTLLHDSQAL